MKAPDLDPFHAVVTTSLDQPSQPSAPAMQDPVVDSPAPQTTNSDIQPNTLFMPDWFCEYPWNIY